MGDRGFYSDDIGKALDISLENKENCCGCGACAQSCPANSITMKEDDEGFLYPYLDLELCIKCGMCENACRRRRTVGNISPKEVYFGYSKDSEIQKKSSSGGVFNELARHVIANEGFVSGAAYNEKFKVEHILISDNKDLYKIIGSKYVQSKINDIYIKVKDELKEGRKVLFSGTPCQVEGLLSYLNYEYENLFTVSLICYGVPSPKVWTNYCNTIIEDCSSTKIKSVNFRDVVGDGRNSVLRIETDAMIYKNNSVEDDFYFGFFKNLYLRPSCYSCNSKCNGLKADIILGDAWGADKNDELKLNINGANAIIINSKKGIELMKGICENIYLHRWTWDEVLKWNPMIYNSAEKNKDREIFWKNYLNGVSLHDIVKKYRPTPASDRMEIMYPVILKYLRKKAAGNNIADIANGISENWLLYANTELMDIIIDDIAEIDNIKIVAISDKDVRSLEKKRFGGEKISFEDVIIRSKKDIDRIVICSIVHEKEIRNEMINKGIRENIIYFVSEMLDMKDVSNEKKCTGCAACQNICTQNAISMKYDEEGFLFPQIDETKCISCGMCMKQCPVNKHPENNNMKHPIFYVAYSKDEKKLLDSSSGGVFSHFAEYIINQQGVVYGAELVRFDVKHTRAEDMSGCEKYRKSKYLQSDIGYVYRNVSEDLKEGKKVLFTGTPCQIAGLYAYLGRDDKNLFTIDLVCHGVPSKKIFDAYIENLTDANRKPISIVWRDKRNGWRPNRVAVCFDDGSELVTPSMENPMQKGFLYNIFLRKSCFTCPYAKLPRVADITLGDNWGYRGKLEDNNKGLSMVIVSSEKGKILFSKIQEQLVWDYDQEDKALRGARHVALPPEWTLDRDLVMRDFVNGMRFDEIKHKYIDVK